MLKIGKLYRTIHQETIVFDAHGVPETLASNVLFVPVVQVDNPDEFVHWPVYKVLVSDRTYFLQDTAGNFRKRYKEAKKAQI